MFFRQGPVIGFAGGNIWIDAQAWFGDSGSGIFTEDGELIGALNMIYIDPRDPQSGVLKFAIARPLSFTQFQLDNAP